ncbi:MAG: tetratricopeptide repeat protein [Deltaproteobacteria bacterium]|nr:tetratricopeptide repeat protein [Deltaproteobacteria bacterium]
MKVFWRALLIALIFATLVYFPDPVWTQTPSPSPSLVDIVEQGYLAHRRGDFDQAIDIFTSIIRRRGLTIKERAVTYLLRGEAKREKGDLEEAVNDFTRAINQWPNYPQAIFFRGQSLANLGRFSEALADLTRAVELDPNREAYKTTLELLRVKMEKAGIDLTFNPSNDLRAPLED